MSEPKSETHLTDYQTKYARQHPAVTRADEHMAMLTSHGKKYTGDDHLQSNDDLEANSYTYTREHVHQSVSDLWFKWDNMAYNVGLVMLAGGILMIAINR